MHYLSPHWRCVLISVWTAPAPSKSGGTFAQMRSSDQLSYFVISASTFFNCCFMPSLESDPTPTLREGSGSFASLWKSIRVALSASPNVPLCLNWRTMFPIKAGSVYAGWAENSSENSGCKILVLKPPNCRMVTFANVRLFTSG